MILVHDSTLFRSRKLSFVWKSTNSSQLVNLKQNNPSKYEELVNDGTVKRAVNIKALKTWLLLGSTNVDLNIKSIL